MVLRLESKMPKNPMLASSTQCRGKEVGKGGDDGFKTVDCLRGRLLAERVASKAAKDEAEGMAKRLDELEKNLADEIKWRKRAERRLKHALRKLESLKVLDGFGKLDLPESSAGSSSSQFLLGLRIVEENKAESLMVDSGQFGCFEEAKATSRSLDLTMVDAMRSSSSDGSCHQLVSQDGSWYSVGTAQSHNKEEPHRDKAIEDCSQEEILDSVRQQSVCSSSPETIEEQTEHDENKLAIVPVSVQLNVEAHRPKINNDVQDVLLALRQVREQLRYSLQRSDIYSHKELFGQ
ncbi:uncharacterized protein [Typha angustifolia]|uniref:uncharacterized protein isoform X1 n=1 Tax=Typha angustifolia TaxID=59011 RepID=UPI003C2AC650